MPYFVRVSATFLSLTVLLKSAHVKSAPNFVNTMSDSLYQGTIILRWYFGRKITMIMVEEGGIQTELLLLNPDIHKN